MHIRALLKSLQNLLIGGFARQLPMRRQTGQPWLVKIVPPTFGTNRLKNFFKYYQNKT
jgi:hypothetical protein